MNTKRKMLGIPYLTNLKSLQSAHRLNLKRKKSCLAFFVRTTTNKPLGEHVYSNRRSTAKDQICKKTTTTKKYKHKTTQPQNNPMTVFFFFFKGRSLLIDHTVMP